MSDIVPAQSLDFCDSCGGVLFTGRGEKRRPQKGCHGDRPFSPSVSSYSQINALYPSGSHS